MSNSQSLLTRTALQDRKRAIAKTVAYRVLMIVVTVAVALAVTGSVGQALSIGIVANAVKTGTYYAHERLWDRIAWGVRDRSSP